MCIFVYFGALCVSSAVCYSLRTGTCPDLSCSLLAISFYFIIFINFFLTPIDRPNTQSNLFQLWRKLTIVLVVKSCFYFILIIVQRDATQSSLFIILQVHSTCFGCQPHPSSGVHKTVTTASGTDHIFLCSYLPPTWPSYLGHVGGR